MTILQPADGKTTGERVCADDMVSTVIIYEPLPDINRAPIWAALARSLASSSHNVIVLAEEQLFYSPTADNKTVSVINCTHVIDAYLKSEPTFKTITLDIPPMVYSNVSGPDIEGRIAQIRAARRVQYNALIEQFQPQTCYVWNGQYNYLRDFLKIAEATRTTRLRFVECGWFPQNGTIYIDDKGVNAASNLADEIELLVKARQQQLPAINPFAEAPLAGRKKSYVFVPLQVDTDTNITIHSSYRSMNQFIAYLERWIPADVNVILRPHPLYDRTIPLRKSRKNFFIDSTASIKELIDNSELVVGLNSTVLLEALSLGKPVITMAKGILPNIFNGESFIDTKPISQCIATDSIEKLVSTQININDLLNATSSKQINNTNLKIGIRRIPFLAKKAYFEYRRRQPRKRHVLIYLPLANAHRLPIFQQLALSLKKSGLRTSILLETQISHYQNGAYKGESNHIRTISTYVGRDYFDQVTLLKWNTATSDYWEKISATRKSRYLEVLEQQRWDFIYIWNGNFDYQKDFIDAVRKTGNEPMLRFCEVGWLSQANSIYVDPLGVNASSYLSITPPAELSDEQFREIESFAASLQTPPPFNDVEKKRPVILVPLQVDTDSNILLSSPFPNMIEFIRHLEKWIPSDYDVILRPHPKADYPYEISSASRHFSVDRQTPLYDLIHHCNFVIGINSTVLIEALCLHKPAGAFGGGVFSASTAIASFDVDTPFFEPIFDTREAYKLLHKLVFRAQKSIRPDLAHKNNPLVFLLLMAWIRLMKKYDA